uniref:FUZ/MON1/HPS1 second Longin domain-containing protein n=1 Tax=Sinocyclocheilus anshuiensis TaxID=1608454 RepID=A0A671L6X8_9TELE
SQEVVVLSVLVHSLSGASSCDYPVFLPQGSPTVAIRLLSFQLLPGAHLCVLCGPKPSLHKAENELIGRFWSTFVENLRSCLEHAERSSLPSSLRHRSPCYVSGLGNISFALLSMQGQTALRFHQKYLNLCSEDERRSYGFETT